MCTHFVPIYFCRCSIHILSFAAKTVHRKSLQHLDYRAYTTVPRTTPLQIRSSQAPSAVQNSHTSSTKTTPTPKPRQPRRVHDYVNFQARPEHIQRSTKENGPVLSNRQDHPEDKQSSLIDKQSFLDDDSQQSTSEGNRHSLSETTNITTSLVDRNGVRRAPTGANTRPYTVCTSDTKLSIPGHIGLQRKMSAPQPNTVHYAVSNIYVDKKASAEGEAKETSAGGEAKEPSAGGEAREPSAGGEAREQSAGGEPKEPSAGGEAVGQLEASMESKVKERSKKPSQPIYVNVVPSDVDGDSAPSPHACDSDSDDYDNNIDLIRSSRESDYVNNAVVQALRDEQLQLADRTSTSSEDLCTSDREQT